MDFLHVARILYARKWLIVASVALTAALTFGATRLTGSTWQATVRLLAPQRSPLTDPGKAAGGESSDSGYGPYAKDAAESLATTLEALAESRDVLEPALSAAQLTAAPDLVDRIMVEAEGPRLFRLKVTDPNPQRAEALSNALADALVDRYRKLTADQADHVIDLLKAQQQRADDDLARARRDFDSYRARRGFLGDPTRAGATNSLELVLARLRDATGRHDDAVRQIADIAAQLATKERQLALLPAMTQAPGPAGPGPVVAQLQGALAQADLQLASLRARYSEQHPDVRRAISSREALADSLKQALRDQARQAQNPETAIMQPNPSAALLREEIARLRQEKAGHEAEARSLEATLAAVRAETEQFRGVDSTLAQLAGDVVTRTEARAGLMARINAAHMAVDVAQSQSPLTVVSRVSRFNPAVNTSAGRTLKLILMAAFCALLAAVGIVVALDSYDRRLRSVTDANLALPARVLAVIPQPEQHASYAALARATELSPRSPTSEAYRFLGLQLLSTSGPQARSLMVLSAKADQGSTTALTNVAITLAQAGKRVVVVDANVRTAELHQVFDLENDFGFSDLMGDPRPETLERAIHTTSVPNLEVITSGPVPRNPWELFRSPNLLELSSQLHRRADFVLYDTPSALIFTDALNLAPVVDAAFLVVRAQEALTGGEQRLVDLLEQNSVRVLGSVLSGVPVSVMEGYPNFRHYHGVVGREATPDVAGPRAMIGQQASSGDADRGDVPVIDLPDDRGIA